MSDFPQRSLDTHIGKLERAAKAQDREWADLMAAKQYSRPGCCVCGNQGCDDGMIYLVPLDMYVCSEKCKGKIVTPFEQRLRDDESEPNQET